MFDGTDWTTVLVAFATGLTAATAPALAHWLGVRKEREGVRAALIAEVVALAGVIQSRQYLRQLVEMTESLRSTNQNVQHPDELVVASVRVPFPEHYNLIYRENATRLGCLQPAEAVDVVRFYQLILSIAADFSPGGLLYEGTSDHDAFNRTRMLLQAALAIAGKLQGGQFKAAGDVD